MENEERRKAGTEGAKPKQNLTQRPQSQAEDAEAEKKATAKTSLRLASAGFDELTAGEAAKMKAAGKATYESLSRSERTT
jgi:hypothetical protein